MRTHTRAYTLNNAKADLKDALERAEANQALADAAAKRGDHAKAVYFLRQSKWWLQCAGNDAERVTIYERAGYGSAIE